MKKYYIYHIKGKKIGCSENPNYRVNSQNYTDYEILHEYDCIFQASDKELELQKQYGYKVDKIPYWKSIENRKKAILKNSSLKKPCFAIDTKTNKIIKEFNSSLQAALWVGTDNNAHIRRCCRDNTKTAYGYKWEYKQCEK